MVTVHVYPLDPIASVRTLTIPADPGGLARAIDRELVTPNMAYLLAHPRTPGISYSGAKYGPDPNEDWNTIPWILRAIEFGAGIDCEDVVGWGAAEDRTVRGIPSFPVVYRAAPLDLHCLLARPSRLVPSRDPWRRWIVGTSGGIEYTDLARMIGMGSPPSCPSPLTR